MRSIQPRSDQMAIDFNLSELGLTPGGCVEAKSSRGSFFIESDPIGAVIRVLRDRCPHRGSSVVLTGRGFTCPSHGWLYNRDGTNVVEGSPGLEIVPFEVAGSVLKLWVPAPEPILELAGALDGSETLELLAHASFLLKVGERRVLFDPWLAGPTYWGSWHHYPQFNVNIPGLGVTDIIITHPHPDHFHLPTLEFFDRSTRVFVPNFESGILQEELQKLGFKDVRVVPWEEEVEISADLKFAFLRPLSQWEDSSCLVVVKNWVWLNQVDAGASLRSELLPAEVDLFTSSFDMGASGWPLTWSMSEGREGSIMKAGKRQMLETIRSSSRQLGARHFAPFAGWWRLGLDVHQELAEKIPHVTHKDLAEMFEGEATKLLKTLPSSKIRLLDMAHSCDEDVVGLLEYPVAVVSWEEPEPALKDGVLVEKMSKMMNELVSLSLAAVCENVSLSVRISGIRFSENFRFGDGTSPAVVEIRVEIPRWIAELLVHGDTTVIWNHLDIGYWCLWERTPDVYPPNFMRLLQMGRPSSLFSETKTVDLQAIRSKAVADFIEKDAELAQAILSRAGLPCVSCTRANSDSLGDAFEIHAVPEHLRLRVEAELSALMS